MLLKIQKYDLSINYVRGKDLHVADTLSRAQLHDSTDEIDCEELDLPACSHNDSKPGSKKLQLQIATENDKQMQQLTTMIKKYH